MPVSSRLSLLCWVLVCAPSCSGRVEAPEGSQQNVAGSMNTSHPSPVAGSAGRASASAGSSALGGSGPVAEDPGDLPVGGADVEVAADAQLEPTNGNAVTGSVHFAQLAEHVDLTLSLTDCPEGAHALHLHANAACGDGANAAGGHWSPQGDGLGDVTCAADGTAQYSYTPADGSWSLGGPASTDLLRHALVLHAGPNLPDPGARIACGIPAKVE